MDDTTPRPKPNFYDAMREHTWKILVGRESVVLSTPRLGKHILYQQAKHELNSCDVSEGSEKKVALFCACLKEALGEKLLNKLEPDEVLPAIVALEDAFDEPPLLAWQEPFSQEELAEKKTGSDAVVVEDNLQYDGRNVAFLITTLANRFGWTDRYILNELTFYQASIYMQEALLFSYQDQEWEYMMSQVGFKEVGKKLEKQPFPSPSWVKKRMKIDRAKLTPVPDRFLPGNPGDEIQELSYDPETGAVTSHAIHRPASSIAEEHTPATKPDAPTRGLKNFGARP